MNKPLPPHPPTPPRNPNAHPSVMFRRSPLQAPQRERGPRAQTAQSTLPLRDSRSALMASPPRDALEGGAGTPPPLPGAQLMPSHCAPDHKG